MRGHREFDKHDGCGYLPVPRAEAVFDEKPGTDEPSTRPLSRSVVQALQAGAGNQAVAALVAQHHASAAGPSSSTANATELAAAEPVRAAPVQRRAVDAGLVHRSGPQSDQKFAAVAAQVRARQKLLAAHPSARVEAARAQGAARPPPDDRQAQGKAANAEKMNAAKPGTFDKAGFVRAVDQAIAAQAPKNLDEADRFGDSGRADAVKDRVQGNVIAGREAAANAIEATTTAPPDTSKAREKPVTPLVTDKPPDVPAGPAGAKAIPDRAPPAATDFSGGPAQVDAQMAAAQVTDEQLARSNEPGFVGALEEKTAVERHAATAPGQVRAAEAKTLAGGQR